MALFARRTLQRLLSENARFVAHEDAAKLVRALSAEKKQTLEAEWEIAALNALARGRRVEHHRQIGGRHLDALVYVAGADEPLFALDVTTVSESGRTRLNPTDRLKDKLVHRVRKAGLDADKFSVQIGGTVGGKRGKAVMHVTTPAKNEVDNFFDASFDEFLRACREEPSCRTPWSRVTEKLDVRVMYEPSQLYFASFEPYAGAFYSLERNPVHNALKGKLEVVQQYLGFAGGISPPEIQCELYTNSRARRPLTPLAAAALKDVLKSLPPPVSTGQNALSYFRGPTPRSGRSFGGGFSVKGDTIRVSSRRVLDLLAGRVSTEQLAREAQGGHGSPRIFETFAKQGRTIQGVVFEACADKDDDWIVFQFGPPDPAVGPFRKP